MIVTWAGHAQVFVNAANTTLLMDPWFAEPVFGGAWFRYPPSPFPDSSMVPQPDFLLLSHTHPDHAGLETLQQMRKGVRVLAVDFASGAMRRRLARAGLQNVHWVTAWQTEEIAPGLRVTFVPHDDGWEVASMIIEADGVRLYHGNDNVLSLAGYQAIAARLGPIDLAFLPYAGASSWPTGFQSDAATLASRCTAKKDEGLARFTDGLEGLRPAEAVPFASSWALLEAGEVQKNFTDRFTAEQVLTRAITKANDAGTKLLHMSPGDEWSAETGVIRKDFARAWPNDVASVQRYAAHHTHRVAQGIAEARRAEVSVSAAMLQDGLGRYLMAMVATSPAVSDRSLFGFAAAGLPGWRVTFARGMTPVIEPGLTGGEDEVITTRIDELAGIVFGTLTWEDVWYGYRLQVAKREGTPYFRHLWDLLLGFDDEGLSQRLRQEFAP